MACIYLTVITADNDISMFHPSQLLCGFTYNIMIFDKIQNMPMCMCYMVQNQMENLTVAAMNLICTQKLQWNFTCIQNGGVLHYFEYTDLRLYGMENNLQK